MDLDDALDQRQADAGALGLGVEPLEELEDLLLVLRLDADAVVSQANVELIVAPGCDAEFIEYQASCGNGDYYGNSVVALQIGEGAAASCVRIQDRKNGHVQTSRLSIAMHKDSRLDMTSYDLGGALDDSGRCAGAVDHVGVAAWLGGSAEHLHDAGKERVALWRWVRLSVNRRRHDLRCLSADLRPSADRDPPRRRGRAGVNRPCRGCR